MAKIKVIGFDADDTLWPTMLYYNQVHDVLKNHFGENGHKTFNDNIKNNTTIYGIATSAVCKAFFETALEINNGCVTKDDARIYEDVKNILENKPAEPFDGVRDVLQELKQNYRIMIITKGQLGEQTLAINKSGLKSLVHDYHIMNDKDVTEYQERIFNKYNIKPSEFVMVGNTPKTDILPVLECGGHGIYIPRDFWDAESTEKEFSNHPNHYQIDDISKVPEVIKRIELSLKP